MSSLKPLRFGLVQLCRWVWTYARHFPRELATVLALMGAGVLLNLLKPWPMVLLIDHLFKKGPAPAWLVPLLENLPASGSQIGFITWIAGATVAIFLLEWATNLASSYANVSLGQKLTWRVSADLFGHLQRLSPRFYSKKPSGDIIRRVTGDAGAVTTIFRDALLPVTTALWSLVLMFSILWHINAILTLLAMAVLPFMALVFKLYAEPMLERGYAQDESEGAIYTVVEQTFSALPAIKAFGRERANEEHFSRSTGGALSAAVSTLSVQLKFKIFLGLVTAIGSAAMMWFGAKSVMQGEMTLGAIILFLSYLASLYAPLETIMYTGSTIQGAGGAARRVMEVLTVDPEVVDRPGAVILPPVDGAVRFEGVAFAYDEGRPTLQDLWIDVAPGEKVALVGPTGAGKSTLVSLIPRFFDPAAGRVLIDGHDLRDVQLASLRGQIALVLQEPFLFPISIAENIAYGWPDASPEQIEAAARAANAHDFILRLPEGYETVVGERGATLSGGERQRISIARALLKDAPVLILDEPTSALDAGTEALIMDALAKLMRRRTTFIIAHRLATVQHADRIIVLDQGRIIETGTHQELIARSGLYANFCALQFHIPAAKIA